MGRLFWIVIAVMALGLVALVATGDSGTIFGLDSASFAQTLYLGLLGAVIAVGILGSGQRFGPMARTLAIWLVIIMALMVGYQYRYELQDVGSRLTAGLIPGSPLAMIGEDGRAAVMIDRMANGHFEIRASINGTTVNSMVDTGATTTVLSSADARRVGFEPENLSYTVPIMTANGPTQAARIVIDEIRIGGISRTRLPALVAAEGQLDRTLLGMNFIGSLSGFDMRGERLILRD
ncbi:TIGR02281 family clan AA aspartic protease [Aliihoeflea sp. 40Bstr573]|uniref:TIGR02281 family clan AA aspartic protease n=1 Tax=Aliihoeflea sp. 40Bstr573 TaxID=2696467 RepID=UPI002094168F|nr:TIGR02281 family clan AA aspartic protease [Aliihoeflea sp. 40Bstr573]MCO6385550.1 TIGR02281 family clan AA aspartic protease [Aliihoeflea sp. 40Bstr573]